MGYGKMEEKFIHTVEDFPPFDFAKLEQILQEGADINAENDGENILSDTLPDLGEQIWEDGYTIGSDQDVLNYVSFFLSHGFDARKHNGAAGAKAIWSMVYNLPCGKLLLEAIRLLLDAGANPSYDSEEDYESLIDSYRSNAFLAISIEDDPSTGEIYRAAEEMLYQASLHRDVSGIRLYSDAIGKRIEDIFSWDSDSRSTQKIEREKLLSYGLNSSSVLYGGLVMICEGMPLSASFWGDLVITPYDFTGKKTKKIPGLYQLIGKTISDIQFKVDHWKFGKTSYYFVEPHIIFSDGTSLIIKHQMLSSPDEECLIYKVI